MCLFNKSTTTVLRGSRHALSRLPKKNKIKRRIKEVVLIVTRKVLVSNSHTIDK